MAVFVDDLKLFTNGPEKYIRFAEILKRSTQFFDALVRYFSASGLISYMKN